MDEQEQEISDLIQMLEDVEQRLIEDASGPAPTGLTDPDDGGTERWEAAQVWAHIAEFVSYWQAQLEKVVDNYHGAAGGVWANQGRRGQDRGHRDGPARANRRAHGAGSWRHRDNASLPPDAVSRSMAEHRSASTARRDDRSADGRDVSPSTTSKSTPTSSRASAHRVEDPPRHQQRREARLRHGRRLAGLVAQRQDSG